LPTSYCNWVSLLLKWSTSAVATWAGPRQGPPPKAPVLVSTFSDIHFSTSVDHGASGVYGTSGVYGHLDTMLWSLFNDAMLW